MLRRLVRRRTIGPALAVLLLAVVIGAVVDTSGSGFELPSPTDLGSDFRAYTVLEGDQVVVVPDGTYTAGDGSVTAPHPATDGEYGGWLVLVAESPHGAVVDLSPAGLTLESGTTRILFVGFTFVDGPVQVLGEHLRFWYTDHTFPYDTWVDAGGPDGLHSRPKTMAVADASDVGLYGADFHHIGDDGINLWNSHDIRLQGVTITDVDNDGHNRIIHADALQTQGNLQGLTVSDSVLERVIVNTESKPGGLAEITFIDTWLRDSRSAGITYHAKRTGDGAPLTIDGSRTGIRSFGHNNGRDRIDTVDGRQVPVGSSRRIEVDDTDITTSPPPSDAPSPADTWRRRHPYDSWRAHFWG